MAAQSVLTALRGLSRQPVALASFAALIVLVSGVVAVTRLVATPATKTRVVYQAIATPAPAPTRTVTVTTTVLVTPSPSPSPSASRHPSPATQLRCSSPQLTLELAANKTHYAQGETIRLTATLRRDDPPSNEYQHFDPRPCVVDPGGFTVYLTDDSHQPVYPYSRPFNGIYPVYLPYTGAQFALARGGTHKVTYTWDGKVAYPGTAGEGPAYAGDYHAVAQWMYPYADSDQITFTLDGPAAP